MGQRYLRTYRRMAQTMHWCDTCCTHIQPGSLYEGDVLVTGGRLAVFKKHVDPYCEFPADPSDDDEKDQTEPLAAAA